MRIYQLTHILPDGTKKISWRHIHYSANMDGKKAVEKFGGVYEIQGMEVPKQKRDFVRWLNDIYLNN